MAKSVYVVQRRIAMTPTILRLTAHMGYRPTAREIAEASGLLREEATLVMREVRCTPHVQEAIAKFAGMTVRKLFGRAAWFRQPGYELKPRYGSKGPRPRGRAPAGKA